MKLTFFTGSVPPISGGEVVNYKLYEYIKSKAINADIIPMTDFIRKHSIKIKWRYLNRINEMVSICYHFWRERGTIFVDYSLLHRALLYLLIQKCVFFSKTLVYVYHFDHYKSSEKRTYKKKIKIWKERLSFCIIDKILTDSQHTKNEIIFIGVQPEKIEILTPGIDVSGFALGRREPSNKKSVFNMLFVGHCFPRKGIKYLVEAVKKLNQHHFILNIVGDTEKDHKYYDSLVQFVTENGLKGKVKFFGRVNQETLAELYSNADIFILPSLWEGFGIVLLEAMYHKLPIIATKISAIPELVVDGENGLLVPPAESEALATAILRLIESPLLRKEMGEKGYQRVINSYSWEQTGEKFYQIVKDLLQ